MSTYSITRFYADPGVESRTIETGLTLDAAQEHCNDPETSSTTATSDEAREHTALYGPWFDGYNEESREDEIERARRLSG